MADFIRGLVLLVLVALAIGLADYSAMGTESLAYKLVGLVAYFLTPGGVIRP